MRFRVSASLARRLGLATVVVAVAGLSAACSDSARFKKPLFTGSTENQRAIIGDELGQQPMPAALSDGTGQVHRAPLPPPPTTTYAAAPNPTGAVGGAYAWSAVGGQVITVGQGESLDILAVKYGVPARQILSANQLQAASQVTPGRIIVIPRRVPIRPEDVSRYQAPRTVAAAAPQAVAAPAKPPTPAPSAAAPVSPGADVHVVQAGDTLYSIARRYGARVDDLATLNGLESAAHIRIGQKLALTSSAASDTGYTSKYAAAQPIPASLQRPAGTSAQPSAPVATASVQPKAPAAPTVPVKTSEPAATTIAAIDAAADPASANGTTFRWPVRGRIISGFGAKAGGERNDGINLAVPEGTSVKATEAGTVIYAGNELEGYGELVLVRHADGWVSAYAHNKELRVKRGDKVRRGQTVALAGRSGSVSTPQVHFELRRGAKPVNPLDYLADT